MIPMKGLTTQGLDLSQETEEDINESQSEDKPKFSCRHQVMINQMTCTLPVLDNMKYIEENKKSNKKRKDMISKIVKGNRTTPVRTRFGSGSK